MIRGLSSLGYNNNEQNKSFLNKAKDYYKSIPFFVRIIISNTIVNYIISFFFSLEYGINIPHNTIFKFRIWTLMTTVMITPSLINIIFAFISWIPSGIRDEKEEGTVYFCIQFFIHSIIIQCLFVLMALVLQFLFPDVMNIPSAGLWPYIIAKLTIYCLKNPENIMMFFVFPWPIKAKYYPWILICFFALINMNIQIDLVCAILYGYAYNHKLKNYLEISINFIQKLEDSLIFKYFKNSTGFILLSNSQGSTGFTASTINNLNKNTNKEDYSVSNILILFYI